MRALRRGGVLAVAGIHLSDVPPLNYEHELFYEKERYAASPPTPGMMAASSSPSQSVHRVRATTHVYPMSEAQQALQDLKAGLFDGAAVLVNDQGTPP